MAHPHSVFGHPAFVRLWLADTVKWFGLFSSGLALQFLLIDDLGADQTDLGVIRAVQWLPMLLFGLIAGVLIDRVPRRLVLVLGDFTCAAGLAAIGFLALNDRLTLPLAGALLFVVGLASMCAVTAHQSFVPRLVPVSALSRAHARLDQAMTTAESVGPLLAGALVRTLGAPVAIVLNAVTYATSAVILLTTRVDEPRAASTERTTVRAQLIEGARWVYRHPALAPYALALHGWFIANSFVMTILVIYAATDLGLGPVVVGLVLASAGVAAVMGAGVAARLADRWGLGRVTCAVEWLMPLAFAVVALAPAGRIGVVVLVAAHLMYGLANGVRDPLTMSYRNAVTPDRLRARMNATIRSVNFGTIVVSAPLAGLLAVSLGNRTTLWLAVAIAVMAAIGLTASSFRNAQMPADEQA